MGEISFNYRINTEPIYEQAFRYWYSDAIEYSFAYQRYIALSDASIFNSPVAITKVATGLCCLYDLFADKEAHKVAYMSLIESFGEIQDKNTLSNSNDFATKTSSTNTRVDSAISLSAKQRRQGLMKNGQWMQKLQTWNLYGSVVFGQTDIKNGNIISNACHLMYQKKAFLHCGDTVSQNIFKNIFKDEAILAQVPLKSPVIKGKVFNAKIMVKPMIKRSVLDSELLLQGNNKHGYINNFTFADTNNEYITNIFKNTFGYKHYAKAFIGKTSVSANRPINALSDINSSRVFGRIPVPQINIDNTQMFGRLPRPRLHLDNTSVLAYRPKLGMTIDNAQAFASLASSNLTIDFAQSFAYLDASKLNIDYTQSFSHLSSPDLNMYNLWSATKDSSGFVVQGNDTMLTKKTRYGISLTNNDICIYRESDDIARFASQKWLAKSINPIRYYDNLFMNINQNDAHVFRQGQSLVKQLITIMSLNFDTVIKQNVPLSYLHVLNEEYSGIILPLSKTKHQGYIDKVDTKLRKLFGNTYISQELSNSVLQKTSTAPLQSTELFCDKKEFGTYIAYRNAFVNKERLHTIVHMYSVASKGSKYIQYKYNDAWGQKDAKDTYVNQSVYINKDVVRLHTEQITLASLDSKDILSYKTLFVDKVEKICYYDYGNTWADKNALDAQINAQLQIKKSETPGIMLDCVSPLIKQKLDTVYDYGVFSSKIIKESQLFNQLDAIQQTVRRLDILPNDFGNWAWVYETPDPFGITYGIDELLLPENDTRYEDFENIIFDKENMRPRNPVKEIDDTTFIAKLPIRHPIPKYKDVGLDYNKGAIKFENFYGVDTAVVREVFLKFYRIWQSKLFEFGTMSMTQSVKAMLEYLYSWIMIYFPTDQIEQALRVFKLIRWYGETSIIQNSQYIISYEYDTLESKLNTGTCLIPNDLDSNTSMYVDAHLGVIRNNPAFIGTDDASVEFYINNRKNTTFTFSLSNTVGSVNIYINDVLVDIVSVSALNLTYPLPYSGDTNVVRIEKTAANNLNGTFYIGNIKVPNCSFKELTIEFDPTLKAGNKPLNEIAKKMIEYANLHENREEVYELMKKGNLGIQETYKRLQEYWEIHHQDKIKGKRLTIKEV